MSGSSEDFSLEKVGQRVARRRKKLGMTQSQLATAAQTTQPSISSLEEGKDARVSSLSRVAKALSCSVSDLLGEGEADDSSISLGHVISKRIREARQARKWSIEDLAEKSKVNVERLRDVEERFMSPGKSLREKLALALDMRESDFLSLNDLNRKPKVVSAIDALEIVRVALMEQSTEGDGDSDPFIGNAIALLRRVDESKRDAALMAISAFLEPESAEEPVTKGGKFG